MNYIQHLYKPFGSSYTPYIGFHIYTLASIDANLNRHALRPSKQYWITCPRKLKSEFDRTPQPNVYK